MGDAYGRIAALLAALALSTATALPAAGADDDEGAELPLEGNTETLAFTTDEGSWLSIDVLPDGGTLVFDLLGDLYTLPIAGGEATRITSGLGYDSQPAVSPDGHWIAFISDRDGADNLWIARRDGSEARRLSDEKQAAMISPAWMPDSRYVVVTRRGQATELAMYHVDGGAGVTLAASDPE